MCMDKIILRALSYIWEEKNRLSEIEKNQLTVIFKVHADNKW